MGTLRIFKHYVRIPFLILGCVEFFIFFFSIFIAVYIRFGGDADSIRESVNSPVLTSLTFAIVMLLSMSAMGLYQISFRGGATGVLLRSLSAYIIGGLFLSLIFYLVPSIWLGRGVMAFAALISFFIIGTVRPVFLHLVDKDMLKVRILVLGTGKRAASILQRLRRQSDRRGFHIVGYLQIEDGVSVSVDPDRVIALDGSLAEICAFHNVDEVVVAVDDRRGSLPTEQLLECKMDGIDVLDLLTFYERETGKLPLDLVNPSWLIYSDGFTTGIFREVVKRLFDLAACLMLLLVTWPIMLITVVAIKIEEGWRAPVFYKQIRVGRFGEPFGVLKFRSMVVDAEKSGAQWATKNDARVTRVGNIIRKLRIDELPQILNVLRGEMSFVGPRPERPEFVEHLSEVVPHYNERHRVKPGITGWAQLLYPYGATDADALQKQQFDLYYVKNYTLFLDMLILMQTVEVVVFGKGAR